MAKYLFLEKTLESAEHHATQQQVVDKIYAEERSYWFSKDALTRYVVTSRLSDSFRKLEAHAGSRLTDESSVLFLCAGDGAEASAFCNLFDAKNVTFGDISPVAVEAGLKRDPRLKGVAANTESTGLPDDSFDLVIVQDGLHHLRNPVLGFVEMLRIARLGVIFIEPHDSLVGHVIGTRWENNHGAINFVFRWDRSLVDQVAHSYLGPDRFLNLSFSYWHHNLAFAKLSRLFGNGNTAVFAVKTIKRIMNVTMGRFGNMFSCVVLKI